MIHMHQWHFRPSQKNEHIHTPATSRKLWTDWEIRNIARVNFGSRLGNLHQLYCKDIEIKHTNTQYSPSEVKKYKCKHFPYLSWQKRPFSHHRTAVCCTNVWQNEYDKKVVCVMCFGVILFFSVIFRRFAASTFTVVHTSTEIISAMSRAVVAVRTLRRVSIRNSAFAIFQHRLVIVRIKWAKTWLTS